MPVRVFVVSPRTGDIILGAPGAANPDKNHCMQTKFCISQGLDWAFPLLFRYSLLSRTGSLKLQVPTRNSHLRPAKIAISPPLSAVGTTVFADERERRCLFSQVIFSLSCCKLAFTAGNCACPVSAVSFRSKLLLVGSPRIVFAPTILPSLLIKSFICKIFVFKITQISPSARLLILNRLALNFFRMHVVIVFFFFRFDLENKVIPTLKTQVFRFYL